eukprot:GHVQ01002264.1.p1 GENE.GHVQ01002264.1~~GHVQ01002264.1.p1  ORF type:complete len:101 (+),score=17.81 GHVQ01002264.1:307-609(+)
MMLRSQTINKISSLFLLHGSMEHNTTLCQYKHTHTRTNTDALRHTQIYTHTHTQSNSDHDEILTRLLCIVQYASTLKQTLTGRQTHPHTCTPLLHYAHDY